MHSLSSNFSASLSFVRNETIFKRTTILRQITSNVFKEDLLKKPTISTLWTLLRENWEGISSRKVKKVTHQCQTKLAICAMLGSRPWSLQTLDRTTKSHLKIIRCKDYASKSLQRALLENSLYNEWLMVGTFLKKQVLS